MVDNSSQADWCQDACEELSFTAVRRQKNPSHMGHMLYLRGDDAFCCTFDAYSKGVNCRHACGISVGFLMLAYDVCRLATMTEDFAV